MVDFPLRLDVYRLGANGREFAGRAKLVEPGVYVVGRDPRSIVKIDEGDVSRIHCLIEVRESEVVVVDRSRAGTSLGTVPVTRAVWDGGQSLVIPHYEIVWRRDGAARQDFEPGAHAGDERARPTQASRLVQDELSNIFGVGSNELAKRSMAFPDTVFTGPVVDVGAIRGSGFFEGECEYLGLGGGLGTFVWIDHLRIWGVPTSRIKVIGQNAVPYANYARYCRYSQIPLHERLRSNSASTPDNIWGFPGYASRESWNGLKRGRLSELVYVFDVFGEPIRQSYTPRASDVFSSIDVEASRIGWQECFLQGKVISLRKTNDGRYAVAYRVTTEQAHGRRDRIMIARYLHVAVGYPATRYTPDLQDFLHTYREDKQLIVNAYERHDEIYQSLEKRGKPAIVIVRGRGIVASRILQRLREARAWNRQIIIVHQMRTPLPPEKAERWGSARRYVSNDVEHQPFNWPKACWGGEFRRDIEIAPEVLRSKMFKSLGGTTTAPRHDWTALVREGAREGWYRKTFGNVSGMHPVGSGAERQIVVTIERGGKAVETIAADFIIDCTGLIADPEQSPFLRDLIRTYALRRNRVSGGGGEQQVTGIAVTNDFEIDGLRNGQGRVFGAGALTQNGPYAPVDSFLGLQYAALRSVEALVDARAPALSRLGPFSSTAQWWKWWSGRSPEGRRVAQ